MVKVNTKKVNENISIVIEQLDNGEGTDFREFLNEMQSTYVNKKYKTKAINNFSTSKN